MEYKLVSISESVSVRVPKGLAPDEEAKFIADRAAVMNFDNAHVASFTPEEEAEIIAEYKSSRTLESLEADYRDFDKQVAEGISAEEFLQQLRDNS